MKLPKLWRKKRGGRLIGSWFVTVRGIDVNLGTKDAQVATERRREALRTGRRNFVDDVDQAASSMEAAGVEEGGGVEVPGVSSPPSATPSPPPPPSPPAPAPILPDAYIPPPSSSAPPDNMAAAAAEVGDGADAGAGGEPPPEEQFGPEELRAVLAMGASELVRLQLWMQGRAAKRMAGAEPPEVQLDPKVQEATCKAWVRQLEIWMPADIPLAPWMVALALPLLYFPAQLAGAKQAAEAAKTAGKQAA